MDDVIGSIYEHKIEEKVQHINSLGENLPFTVECEEEGKIAFIDMKLIHERRKLSLSWYNKPTDTGLIINFHALAPKHYKRSVSGVLSNVSIEHVAHGKTLNANTSAINPEESEHLLSLPEGNHTKGTRELRSLQNSMST